jgi:uncharacterized protein YacL
MAAGDPPRGDDDRQREQKKGVNVMITLLRILFASLGGLAGYQTAQLILSRLSFSGYSLLALIAVGVVLGAGIGLILAGIAGRHAPRLNHVLDRVTARVSAAALVVTSIGLIVGLGVGALVSLAVKDLPVIGVFLPPLLYVLAGYVFSYMAYKRHVDIARLMGFKNLLAGPAAAKMQPAVPPKILDTSVIIDARIGDIIPTHFVDGDLVIPQFVLEELQSIADSAEPRKRARGRRGLECVDGLQKAYDHVVIIDRDFPGLTEVDAKLLKLAKELSGRLVTTDYNLNKMAQIQGIDVLNINQLANALKPVVLPGESLEVRVIREGKELDQGVAYLDDGTMVVVEGGRDKVGQAVEVEVTSVLQNPSGKMVFTRLAS